MDSRCREMEVESDGSRAVTECFRGSNGIYANRRERRGDDNGKECL